MNNYKTYQEQYAEILKKLLNNPRKNVMSRVGDVGSNFVELLRIDLQKEFPLLDLKKISFSNVLHELLWIISGKTNIKYLIENNCNIWTDDAFRYYKSKYEPIIKRIWNNNNSDDIESLIVSDNVLDINKESFIDLVLKQRKVNHRNDYGMYQTYTFGDLDAVYGYQWRKFNGWVDQLKGALEKLKTDPDNRRNIVTAHNPSDIESNEVGLPSCHNYFQFYTEPIPLEDRIKHAKSIHPNVKINNEKQLDELNIPQRYINIFVNIRSNDWFLGQPYNMPSYSLLLMMYGKLASMIPKEVTMLAVDCHLYDKHIDAAKEYLKRYTFALEESKHMDSSNDFNDQLICKSGIYIKTENPQSIDDFKFDDFELTDYNPQSMIKAELLT